MSSAGLYLASVAGPIAKRAVMALGFGTVTYVGLDAALGVVKSNVISSWGAIPSGALAIMSMAGVSQAMGIVLGAIVARVSMIQLKRFGLV